MILLYQDVAFLMNSSSLVTIVTVGIQPHSMYDSREKYMSALISQYCIWWFRDGGSHRVKGGAPH